MEPMKATFSEKGGRDVAYLVPTKVFLKSQQLPCSYFSLCTKAYSPPSIIPFPLTQDLPISMAHYA